MKRIHSRFVRPLLAGALLSLSAAAGAQRPTIALGDGPWTYATFEQGTRIRVSIVTRDLSHPWGMAFLPGSDGGGQTMADALITEREGRVRLFKDGRLLPAPVADLTEVLELDQLFDIALHPDFERNRFVYFTYMKRGAPPDASADYYATTALARGRFEDGRLTDLEDVFVADAWSTLFGGDASRLTFAPDGNLFMNVSHRRSPEPPQDLASHIGKVLRLTDEGQPAPGNPFADDPAALPEIYSYGHRTVMDLVFHPETGALWELENGPNGGDEANIIEAGANYGWPIVTYGRDYDGSRFAPPAQEGMRQPEIFWVPSPTVSSMLFYTGDRFPAWRGNLFVTAMTEGRVPGTGHLQRIVLNENGEIRRERLLTDLRQRMRHIIEGPDGLLYVLTDETDAVLLRIEPAPDDDAASEPVSRRMPPRETSTIDAGSPLFVDHDCSMCHQTERRSIGPAYVEIAHRYGSTDDAVDRLAAAIIQGVVGQWGETPMMAHPGIGIDEARSIVRTILALDPQGGG